MQQFLDVFSELKGKNFYVTGESVRPLHLYKFTFSLADYLRLASIQVRRDVCAMSVFRNFERLEEFLDFRKDIANYIYNNPDLLDWNLKGFWINNRMRHCPHGQSCL